MKDNGYLYLPYSTESEILERTSRYTPGDRVKFSWPVGQRIGLKIKAGSMTDDEAEDLIKTRLKTWGYNPKEVKVLINDNRRIKFRAEIKYGSLPAERFIESMTAENNPINDPERYGRELA